MSLNRLFADQPQPEIAGSARLLGSVHVGAGAILAQGTVVRSHDDSVVIGKIDVVTRGDVRRAKLYYLRGRVGKAAKIKEKRAAR